MTNGKWSAADVPSQAGKLAVVTGATGGLGFYNALELARAGAEVILAGRNPEKGRMAVEKIARVLPHAAVQFELLDLASLASVREFAARRVSAGQAIDLLINNAGVMTPPRRCTTDDGFELQFGTNHLGHFALTGRLLPLLLQSNEPRVVTVSSLAHRMGADIHFDDLQWSGSYHAQRAYSQSKLANLLFMFELQRRSIAGHWGLMSNAAHPGAATTNLIPNGPGRSQLSATLMFGLVTFIGHSASAGALPTLFAATSPYARGTGYYGPNGLFELRGGVAPAVISAKAQDAALARRLWQVSEELTGVEWGHNDWQKSQSFLGANVTTPSMVQSMPENY